MVMKSDIKMQEEHTCLCFVARLQHLPVVRPEARRQCLQQPIPPIALMQNCGHSDFEVIGVSGRFNPQLTEVGVEESLALPKY
jgi:hypothetical protein